MGLKEDDILASGFVETSPGVYEKRPRKQKRAILPHGNKRSTSQPKPTLLNGAVGKVEGEKKNTGRVLVRIVTHRVRPTDPDNNNCKYVLDCLRYCGLLCDDREENIVLEVSQKKIKGEEKTVIELFEE